MEKPVFTLAIPCLNEEEVLPVTSGMFLKKVKSLPRRPACDKRENRVMFVNDGSKDDT